FPAAPLFNCPFHVRQHFRATGSKKPPEEKSGDREEQNVQHRRVIKTDRGLDDLGAPMLRNQPQKTEKKLDDQRGQSHRNVTYSDDHSSDLPAILLPTDVDDRGHK